MNEGTLSTGPKARLVDNHYPHIYDLLHQDPGPQILLGEEIFWTEKKDGSCLGCFLNEEGELQLRTRKMDSATPDFYNALERTGLKDKIIELLQDASNWGGNEYILFGELCTKGRSPTRIERHEDDHFVLFDIYSRNNGKFMPYVWVHQQAHHFDIPMIELYGTSNSKDLTHLFETRDAMLKIALDKGREGVVGKCYVQNQWNAGENAGTKNGIIYFKEKHDTPRLEKLPRLHQDGSVNLPYLPDSEVYGAIEKVRADFGDEDFRNIKLAMPRVAEYVAAESSNHCCQGPEQKLIVYYKQRLKDITVQE